MKLTDMPRTVIGGHIRDCQFSAQACASVFLLLFWGQLETSANDVISTSPQGNLVATAVDGGRIEIRSLSSSKEMIVLQHKGVPAIEERRRSAVSWMPSFVFSPDGSVLASKCAWLPVTLWNVQTGRMLWELPNAGVGYELRFSPDGSRLIGSGLVDKAGLQRLSLWNVTTGDLLRELTVDTPLANEHWDRNSIRPQFAKSGPMLVIDLINKKDRSLRVWDTANNEPAFAVKIDRHLPTDWVISTDGKFLLMREYSGAEHDVIRHRIFELGSGTIIKDWAPAPPAHD